MRGIGSWLRTLRPIDEAAYLNANPDVRAAIQAGDLRSGRQHYRCWGRAEGRPLVPPPPSRRDKLLDGLDLERMAGVEIGALTSPIVSKQEAGERILYVDHLDTEGLRQKYSDDQLAGATLVDVDRVWGEQTLQDCIGPGLKVDYVLNSHVIEHVPDIVTWLQEIHAILRPDGRLRMAIPDRRYTFDFLRRESTLADALGAYVQRARSPLPRAILDHFLYEADVDPAKAWAGEVRSEATRPKRPPQHALEFAERAYRTGLYLDAHCWVFTPLSFAELCGELASLGLLHLACERIYPTETMHIEFIASLRPARDGADAASSWQAARAELRAKTAER